MTDLTLSQFESLSEQELDNLLQQEKFEMHGGHLGHLAARPTRSFSVRLLDFIASSLRIPISLQRKLFPKLRPNSRF